MVMQLCEPVVIDQDSSSRCNEVLHRMQEHLSPAQYRTLKSVMTDVFFGNGSITVDDINVIDSFLMAKAVEGCTEKTLLYYKSTITAFYNWMHGGITGATAATFRDYLSYLKNERGNSDATLNNVRRNMSSFYQWLNDEGIISSNPIRKVKAVRTEKRKKKPFSDTEVELIRQACTCVRDRALVELLNSSGMRVGELAGLRIGDVDIPNRECVVFGKGRKERVCFMSDVAAMYLQEYLDQRDDECDSLFVTQTKPYRPMTIGTIESRVRHIGRSAGVDKVHPHRFRRTMASRNLKRGMQLDEIKDLLGHESMDTTLLYAVSDKEVVKGSVRRLMG